MAGNENNIKNYSEYVHGSTNGHTITIDFSKIFNEPSIKEYDKFTLEKRSYYSINKLITQSIVQILNDSKEEALIPYLNVMYKIYSQEEYDVDDFISDVINNVANNIVSTNVSNFIDKIYIPEMDEKTKRTKKINTELQFTDEHVKILLKCSEIIRFTIPLINIYIHEYDVETDDVLYKTFKAIIEKYEGNLNLLNKLHRFIYARIVSTQYSDRTIWILLTNRSKDVNIFTKDFFKDIIVGILPKSVASRSLVNFLHVVIKRKTVFEFSKNYKITYNPANLNQVDSDGLTQFDKWENSMAKKDESRIILNHVQLNNQITVLKNNLGIKISKNEFKYYYENLNINTLQKQIIFLFFAKYIGNYDNLYSLNRKQYVTLAIIISKYFKTHNYELLADYITAVPSKLIEKRVINTAKIYEKITSSRSYNDLLNYKFASIERVIIENNIIIKLVANLLINKYIILNSYSVYKKTGEVLSNEEVVPQLEKLSNEVINLLKQI